MEKEIFDFIKENNLGTFTNNEAKTRAESIFKTREGRTVYNKVIMRIEKFFCFKSTSRLLNLFSFTNNANEIKKGQEFFRDIKKQENMFLKNLKVPKATWHPSYDIVVVTEDEKIFEELQKLDCPVKFLISEDDVEELERYDIVQVIECDNFSRILESLPQTVFFNSIDEIYLERFLSTLSGWKENFRILKENRSNEKIEKLISELEPLLKLTDKKQAEKINEEDVIGITREMNSRVSEELKKISMSGEVIFDILSRGALTNEIKEIIEKEIERSELPEELFIKTVPIATNLQELEKFIKQQKENENTNQAEKIKRNAELLKKIPEKLKELEGNLLFYDFVAGISQFIFDADSFPECSSSLEVENVKNIFLEKAQPVSFSLDEKNKCSILTGANSGGKTTLLEHIIQLIILFNIGLPIKGRAKIPLFSEVYYFAKNKGSSDKGAFENLLSQMAKIKPGNKTLILADEIESVTEPGVAGKIISATAEYFLGKNCFLVVATHLGREIQKNLPEKARIDGIEARGLDEFNELIVDHNPVLGMLASSTPELIIEKMAKTSEEEYFKFLFENIKKIS